MKQLSKRLTEIVDLMDQVEVCADVGCDHGFLIIHLCKIGKVSKGLGVDIHEGPLEKGKIHVALAGMENKIQLILSDGFKQVPTQAIQGVIIAGMGGRLIADIIKRDLCHLKDLEVMILSPHSEPHLVREAILSLGMHIHQEVMVKEDGKYYTHIKVYPGREDEPYLPEEIAYGRMKLHKDLGVAYEYLCQEKKKYTDLIKKLKDSDGFTIQARKKELDSKLNHLNRLLLFFEKNRKD